MTALAVGPRVNNAIARGARVFSAGGRAVNRLRRILCLLVFPTGRAFLGRAAASNDKADVAVGLAAGALAGVCLGLVFGGVRGKWLGKVFGPDEDGEGEPAAPAAYPAADESFARRHAAGWSAGEAKELTPAGPRWRVSGASGENVLGATGETQAEAWHRAAEQARSLGMLGRVVPR
jgi:hypothetical protein